MLKWNFWNIYHFLTMVLINYKKPLKLLIQMQRMDLFKNCMINFREIMEKYK